MYKMSQSSLYKEATSVAEEMINFQTNLVKRYNRNFLDWLNSEEHKLEEQAVDRMYENTLKYLVENKKNILENERTVVHVTFPAPSEDPCAVTTEKFQTKYDTVAGLKVGFVKYDRNNELYRIGLMAVSREPTIDRKTLVV